MMEGSAEDFADDGRPGVVFTMRYGNEIGYVWLTIARLRDLVARHLQDRARCYIAYPHVSEQAAYRPRWLTVDQANFYDYSPKNRAILAEYVRRRRIRTILFMSASPSEIDLDFLRQLGLETVNTENDSFDHEQRQSIWRSAAKFTLRRILKRQLHDVHVANSQAQFDFLASFAQIPRRRLRLIKDGVDTDRFLPAADADARRAACAEIGLDPEAIWIMAASQSRPEKRVEHIIEAARRIGAARPAADVRFFYVGDGECRGRWQAEAADLGERFRFLGGQTDLTPFYRAASGFVHASFRESFGLVIAEAMSSGLPVVATRSHGAGELVADGETGFLADRHDMAGFTAALLRYIDDPSLRQRHGAAGRERCVEHFSIERQARHLAEILTP
jgi:glycosyltransferase involved in cell wall biosynthesis